jgi:hypothetical protein
MKAMLDSMIFDLLIADEEAAACVRQAIADDRLDILITHVQRDQHTDTPDADKRAKLAQMRSAIQAEVIPTHGAVVGVSRVGMARLTDENDRLHEVLTRIPAGNSRHITDALITATTMGDADVLVTEDGLLRRRVQRMFPELPIWSFKNLIDHLSASRP